MNVLNGYSREGTSIPIEGGRALLQEQLGHKNLKTTAKYIRLCIHRSMHTSISPDPPSDRQDTDRLPKQNFIGQIALDYGEEYIKLYKPPHHHTTILNISELFGSVKHPHWWEGDHMWKMQEGALYLFFMWTQSV